MKIKKRDQMPILPQMFSNLNPPPLKPIPYNGGFVRLLWEGMRLEKIKEMHNKHAEIAEAMYRQTKAMADGFYETMTLSKKIEHFHEAVDHERVMMGHAETKSEAEATNAIYEARIAEYEFKMREREYTRRLEEDQNEE